MFSVVFHVIALILNQLWLSLTARKIPIILLYFGTEQFYPVNTAKQWFLESLKALIFVWNYFRDWEMSILKKNVLQQKISIVKVNILTFRSFCGLCYLPVMYFSAKLKWKFPYWLYFLNKKIQVRVTFELPSNEWTNPIPRFFPHTCIYFIFQT